MQNYIINSPIGKLAITIEEQCLAGIEFFKGKLPKNNQSKIPLIRHIEQQLQNYFANHKYRFSIGIKLKGTEFQQRVWSELQKIPNGQVKTYGEIAQSLKTSPRAVGNACRANPILLIIPCHRVIGKNSLGGFSGHRFGKWLKTKKQLLQHEKYLA